MMSYKLFYTEGCFNCPPVKEFLNSSVVKGEHINASEPSGLDLARNLDVFGVPTVIFFEDDKEIGRADSVSECQRIIDENA